MCIDAESVVFGCVTPVSILKQSNHLAMEILHLKYLGDRESVAMNTVVVVLAECHISMATHLRGYLFYCNVLGN